MTPLSKPLSRRVPGVRIQGRELVVTLTGHGIALRLERERSSAAYFVEWRHVYERAGYLAAQRRIAERKARRKAAP